MEFPTFDPAVQRAALATGDYARYASLALAIRRIEEEQIPGAFAEIGVYRGATSRFLLGCAPGRTLYLFDTFEGFPLEDREPENREDPRFRDTSSEAVRRALGAGDNVVIRKGRFPGTAVGLEAERFAFVLLDLDVFDPTLAGLEFFYPRLAPGAYLFVHDYNSPESNQACRRAVTKFMAGKTERLVELPDVWGSVVIRKS
jgi:O-methyltransferase